MDERPKWKPKGKTGFAGMSPEKQREIASKGGKGVPKENRSFSKDRSLARSAGRAGGLASHRKADAPKP